MVAGNTITNWTLGLALPAAAARAVLAAQARALGCAVVTFAEAADLLAAPVWPQALLVDETFLTARDGGAELLAALQTRSPACASILLTGTERRWTAAALRAGAHAYLVKPIAPAEFQAVLARLLAEQAQRQAASSEQEVFASLLASSAELHGALDEQETLLRILTGFSAWALSACGCCGCRMTAGNCWARRRSG